jgi:putative acetyltransferase
MYTLDIPSKNEYPDLLSVWESSVKATHHFLREGDIEVIKKVIQEKEVFDQVSLTVARNGANKIVGIMGVAEKSLAMLFIDGACIGKGIGKLLILHAIDQLKVNTVEVNEQNVQAITFYEHFGFKTISRTEQDEMGYPSLHMQLV